MVSLPTHTPTLRSLFRPPPQCLRDHLVPKADADQRLAKLVQGADVGLQTLNPWLRLINTPGTPCDEIASAAIGVLRKLPGEHTVAHTGQLLGMRLQKPFKHELVGNEPRPQVLRNVVTFKNAEFHRRAFED